MRMYMHTIMSSPGRDCVLIILFQLYGPNAGFFKVICSGWVNMTPPHNLHIGRRANPVLETYLNNSKTIHSWYYHIDSDAISFLKQVKIRKNKKLTKITKMEEAKIHMLWVIWWISIKFSGKI